MAKYNMAIRGTLSVAEVRAAARVLRRAGFKLPAVGMVVRMPDAAPARELAHDRSGYYWVGYKFVGGKLRKGSKPAVKGGDLTANELRWLLRPILTWVGAHVNEWAVRDVLTEFTSWGFWQQDGGQVMAIIDEAVAQKIVARLRAFVREAPDRDVVEVWDRLHHYEAHARPGGKHRTFIPGRPRHAAPRAKGSAQPTNPPRDQRRRCGCESERCDHGSGDGWHQCRRPAGEGMARGVGHVCDRCADTLSRYLTKLPRGWEVFGGKQRRAGEHALVDPRTGRRRWQRLPRVRAPRSRLDDLVRQLMTEVGK